jgi:AraC family transcriptional regulator
MNPEPAMPGHNVESTSRWIQLAPPSPWKGVEVAHFLAPPSEVEYFLPSTLAMTLRLSGRAAVQTKGPLGRWHETQTQTGDVDFTPARFAGSSRWFEPMETICVYIDRDWLFGEDSRVDDLPRRLLERPPHSVRDGTVKRLIEDILDDARRGAPCGLPYAEALALAALHRLAAQSDGSTSPKVPLREEATIRRATSYIQDNLAADMSVRDVACAAGFAGNLYSFIRLFKRHVGRTPHQFIMQARLDRAKSMLLYGTLPITEVAHSCGFSSLSHFSAAFRTWWGKSPRATRQLR